MSSPPPQERPQKAPETPQQLRERLGRPSLLTPERQAAIVRLVAAGSYLNVAAQHSGVGRSTLMSWLQRGRLAASARDAHDPDLLYCPGCDLMRSPEVEQIAAEQEQLDNEHAAAMDAWQIAVAELPEDGPIPEEPQPASIAFPPCSRCGSPELPAPWQIPDEELRYLDFLEAVTRADTQAEVTAATAWRAAFTTDWRAARDYLVRRHPDRWAATQRVSISTEESEQRIDRAVSELLTIIDGDGDPASLDGLDLDMDSDREDREL